MNDLTYVTPELNAYRELNKILDDHTITGHQRDAMRACAQVLDRALAAQRRQIAEDIEDDRVRHTGAVSLAFYAGMERAAAVVKNDIKAGA